MTVQTQLRERKLKNLFYDNLNKGTSTSAILVYYLDETQAIKEIGIPYAIFEGNLFIGPYVKDITTSFPKDYETSKRKIPIRNILKFRKIELSDIV